MAVIGNAPFQGLVSGGEILDASIEGVDLSTSAIAARLGYTPVDPGAAAITGGTINNTTIGATTAASGAFTTLTTSSTVTHNGGTASGVAYLNGSKVLTTGSALTFDGGVFGVSDSSSPRVSVEGSSTASGYLIFKNTTSGLNTGYVGYEFANNAMPFAVAGSEQMRLTSGVLSVGPSSGAGAISIGSSAGRAQYQYINFGGAQGGVDYAWQIGRNSSTAGVGPADGFYIYDIKASATRLAIDGSGRVTIGTITPGSSGSAKFTVTGNSFVVNPNTDGKDTHVFTTGAVDEGTYAIKADTVTKVYLHSNGSSYLNGGSVGIGLTAPAQKLHVNASYGINSSNPAVSGTTQNGILRLTPNAGTFGETLDFGMNIGPTYAWIQSTNWAGLETNYSLALNPNGGNVGVGTTNPVYKLHVNGTAYVNGTFLHSALASYPQQSISLSVGTTAWVKLFTITSPGGCRVRYNCGSNNSEEQGEFSVKGTYVAAGTQLTWSRQTYYHNLNEIRVTGSNSTPYTVWALIRTTDFAPNFNWQVIEALNSVTLHNTTGETPGTAVATISGPGYSSTNFNHDVTTSNNLGIGTVAPTAKLHVRGLAGNAIPFINFETVSPNSTFNWVSQAMASNLASGNNLVHFIGQDPSTKNSGYIGYKHSSNASDNNILTFGLYGVDNVLNINGAGKVGISTQQPLHTLDVNGSVGVNELYGRTSRDTSGGNIDLTEYNANNFIILEVFGSINPNAGGSSYVDPIHMYVYVGRGWNGSALTSYIYVQHVAPPARDVYPSGGGAGNAIAAVWTNGSTELDTVDAGTTSYYVRLKAYNYNSSFGSGFNVRVIRRA